MKYVVTLPFVDNSRLGGGVWCDLRVHIETTTREKAVALASGHAARMFCDPQVANRSSGLVEIQEVY